MEKYKSNIPNILTISRIVLTPVIIILGLLGKHRLVLILAILCALTDLVDGRLARKWNVVSKTGAKLDAVADKIFAIGLTACFVRNFAILIIPLILEIVIGLTNLYYHYKTEKTTSLMIGKIKTTFLFISIIVALINSLFNKNWIIMNGFIYATINLQILSLISYFINFLENIKEEELSVEDNITHNEIMSEDLNDDKTIEIESLIDLTKKYGLYEEDNN